MKKERKKKEERRRKFNFYRRVVHGVDDRFRRNKPIEMCRKFTGQSMQVDHEVNTSEDAESSSPSNRCSPKTNYPHQTTKKQMQQTNLSRFLIKQPQTCVQSQQHMVISEELQSQSSASEIQNSVKEFHTQLDTALKDGYVEILTAKCSVSGPPWSGKTIFKALLSGKKRPSGERESTAIATEPEQMTPIVDMSSNFHENLLEMHRTQDGSHVRWFVTDNKKLALLVANTLYDRKNPITLCVNDRRRMSKTRKKILEDLTKLMKRELTRNPKGLKGMRLIYVVDTGGQPQFQEIMPIFVRSSSVHFLVHKLNESLDDCPQFDYQINGIKYTVPEKMLVSNKVYLEQSLRTISSGIFARSIECRITTSIPKPRFAVIGMFKDQCTNMDDKQKAVNKCIKPFTESKRCVAITPSRHTDKPIFAIDGSEQGWSTNDDTIDDLHTHIENFTGNLGVKIPIRWILFLNVLKEGSKGKSFLSLQKCYELCRNEDIMMDDNDVDKALELFDELNLVLHFPKFLHDIVFISPAFLFNKVSEIIVQSFDCDPTTSEIISSDERLRFRTTGILEKSMIRKVKSIQEGFDTTFALDDLFVLLDKLCIVADIDNDRFFIPCVLALEEDDAQSEFLKRTIAHMHRARVEPLIISFSDDYSPRGLFCASIAFLARLPNWHIESDSFSLEHKRNLIEFEVHECTDDTSIGNVVIVDKLSCVKIYTTCDRKYLCDIRRNINKALWYASTKCLSYSPENIDLSTGFSCDIDCGKPKPHGTAVQDRDDPQWWMKCLKNKNKQAKKLNERQLPWFSATVSESITTTTLGSEVTVAQLMNEIVPNTNDWETIALQLDIDPVQIERIERQERGHIKPCFRKVFAKWQKQQKPPFTWVVIINALNCPSVAEYGLAKKLKEKYIH